MTTKSERTEIEVLKNEIKNIKDQNAIDHKMILEKVVEVKSTVDKFIGDADKRYASKTVEKIVYGLIGIIVTVVLYAILKDIGINF